MLLLARRIALGTDGRCEDGDGAPICRAGERYWG